MINEGAFGFGRKWIVPGCGATRRPAGFFFPMMYDSCHVCNTPVCLGASLPQINVGIGIFILLGASTMFMKLVSYVAINAEERIKLAKRARIARKIGSPPPVPSGFEDDGRRAWSALIV